MSCLAGRLLPQVGASEMVGRAGGPAVLLILCWRRVSNRSDGFMDIAGLFVGDFPRRTSPGFACDSWEARSGRRWGGVKSGPL